jgi:hypothetical protein
MPQRERDLSPSFHSNVNKSFGKAFAPCRNITHVDEASPRRALPRCKVRKPI